jgi:hypothetical protein
MCNNNFNDKTGIQNADYQLIISRAQANLIENEICQGQKCAALARVRF